MKQPVIISFLQVHILPAVIFDPPADVGLVFGCRGINHCAADFPLSKQSDFVAALRGCQRRLGNKYLSMSVDLRVVKTRESVPARMIQKICQEQWIS